MAEVGDGEASELFAVRSERDQLLVQLARAGDVMRLQMVAMSLFEDHCPEGLEGCDYCVPRLERAREAHSDYYQRYRHPDEETT